MPNESKIDRSSRDFLCEIICEQIWARELSVRSLKEVVVMSTLTEADSHTQITALSVRILKGVAVIAYADSAVICVWLSASVCVVANFLKLGFHWGLGWESVSLKKLQLEKFIQQGRNLSCCRGIGHPCEVK